MNGFCLFLSEMFLVSNHCCCFFRAEKKLYVCIWIDVKSARANSQFCMYELVCVFFSRFFFQAKMLSERVFFSTISLFYEIHDIIYKFKIILEIYHCCCCCCMNLEAFASLKLTRHPHFSMWVFSLYSLCHNNYHFV